MSLLTLSSRSIFTVIGFLLQLCCLLLLVSVSCASDVSKESVPRVIDFSIFDPNVPLHNDVKFHRYAYNSTLNILIPEEWMAFHPKPEFIEGVILYLNFDDAFYKESRYTNTLFSKPAEVNAWIVSMQTNLWKYSNKRLMESGLRVGINVELRDVEQFSMVVATSHSANFDLFYMNELVTSPPDIVLGRIGSKVSHYAMSVLFHLEKMGVQVLNGFEAHVNTADKLYQLQSLAQASFPIPKSLLFSNPVDDPEKVNTKSKKKEKRISRKDLKLQILSTEFQFPIIVKKLRGQQGKGIMLVEDIEHFNDLDQIMEPNQPYLIQEYIAPSHGRDIRIFTFGGKVVGSMMRVAREGFKSNFHLGGFVKRVKLNDDLEWLAIEASNHLGLEVSGVDVLIGNGTYKICEVNSSPGFQGLESATQIDIAAKIMKWISIKTNTYRRPT